MDHVNTINNNTMENDPLVDVTCEWSELEEILMQSWPKSMVVYYWIKMRLQWRLTDPSAAPFFVCCPEGDIKNGLVTFGKVGKRTHFLTILNFHNDSTKLNEALLETARIPWKDKMTCGIPQELRDFFSTIIQQLGYKIQYTTTTSFYTLPKEIALAYEIECPPGVYIAKIRPSDVPTIDAEWPHRFEGSDKYLSELVRLNYGYGVYSKDDHSLLSWVIKFEYMDAGVLQTLREYQRKGYAKILVQTISKRIAEEGENPHAYILEGNNSSERLFLSLGYKRAGIYDWIDYK